jgi:ubiquinone/menaquinone biosynthesis C-methylase UbiE
MHGKNSEENRNKQIDYYDNYVKRQKRVGVNKRHESILQKSIANGLKKDHNVLEIGCGIGTFSGLLGKYLQTGSALCMDISPASIELAKETYQDIRTLHFTEGNAVTYGFKDAQYDSIILPDVLEHIPEDQHLALFERLSGLLKKNGSIFIHIPNPLYLEWCHEHRPELLQIIDQPIYTEKLMAAIRPAHLHVYSLNTYSIWVEDGDYQFIVLKKDNYQDFTKVNEEKPSFMDKVKYKLNRGK